MLGWINLSVQSFITTVYGADKWDQVVAAAGVSTNWVQSSCWLFEPWLCSDCHVDGLTLLHGVCRSLHALTQTRSHTSKLPATSQHSAVRGTMN